MSGFKTGMNEDSSLPKSEELNYFVDWDVFLALTY